MQTTTKNPSKSVVEQPHNVSFTNNLTPKKGCPTDDTESMTCPLNLQKIKSLLLLKEKIEIRIIITARYFIFLELTFGGMKSCRLRGDFLSSYTKVEVGYNP